LIANTLFKKLEALESQKNTLLQQVEQEEEYLTNTLQKKLHDVDLRSFARKLTRKSFSDAIFSIAGNG